MTPPNDYGARSGMILWEDFTRARREMRRYIAVLFALFVVFVTLTFWKGEHDSCTRSSATRETQREIIASTNTYNRIVHPPRRLVCSKLLPDH